MRFKLREGWTALPQKETPNPHMIPNDDEAVITHLANEWCLLRYCCFIGLTNRCSVAPPPSVGRQNDGQKVMNELRHRQITGLEKEVGKPPKWLNDTPRATAKLFQSASS